MPVVSEAPDQAAGEFLAAAYPDQRQRGHAQRWLGLLACQAAARAGGGGGGDGAAGGGGVAGAAGGLVRWWEIPAMAPAGAMLTVRWLALCAVAGVVSGWGINIGVTESTSGAVGGYLALLAIGVRWVLVRSVAVLRHPPGQPRPKPPRAIRPHWPRRRTEYGQLLLGALPLGLGILPVLVRQWSVHAVGPDAAAPAVTYRTERLSCLVTGLAWAPVGALFGALPAYGTDALAEVVTAHALAAAIMGALLSGSYPLLKLSEVVLSADWEDRARFMPLLEDAADRGVLRRTHGDYEFRDDALRTSLIASGRAALAEHARSRDHRLARKGVRAALVAGLTRRGKVRVSVDFGAGVAAGAAIGAGLFIDRHGGVVSRPGGASIDWALYPVSAIIGAMAGMLAGSLMPWVLSLVASASRMALTYLPPWSRKARLGRAAVAVVAAAVLIDTEGTVLARTTAFALPALLVVACGTWACVLTFQRTRMSVRRWQRALPDAIAAATIGATLLLLLDHRLLDALPAAGLLFPVAGWGSFLLWRTMTRSERLVVKAGADLVFALLLGGETVMLLVWLANLLGLPRAEVVALRAVLDRAGGLADLPWWAWTGAWLLLAAAGVAFVRWPGRLKEAAERFERWRIVSVTEITERALTGVHIGLLTLVFVGLAAPPTLTSTVGRQLSAAYEVAFQRELLEEGELAAYTAISSQLAGQPQSPVLIRLVTRIHDISPPDDPKQASATETENARRLGEAEALALSLRTPPSLELLVRDATAAAGLTRPVPRPSDLAQRAGTVQQQETKDDEAAKRVEVAADLAAKAVASLISIPRLSDNEVVQVVREYLAGLIEDSPLKNTFAAWIERLPGAKPPPDAEAEVVPVPGRLERAATAELSAEFTAAGGDDPVTDPFGTDPALSDARAEDPLDGAVDIINQARYAQNQSGPCAGCAVPGNPGGPGGPDGPGGPGEEPQEDHPVEP